MARTTESPGDFLRIVGASPTHALAVTLRVMAPWVMPLWFVLGRLTDLPLDTVSRALWGELGGLLLTWAVGKRLRMGGLQILAVANSVGLATAILAVMRELSTATGILLGLAAAFQFWLGRLVRAYLILGKPLPFTQLWTLLEWQVRFPRPLDWQPRRLPPRLRDLLRKRFPPPERTPPRLDGADLATLGVRWPCTVADLERALARARDRLATIPAARKREELYAVQQAGRAYQRLVALLEGDETSPSLGTGYVPDLGQLWYQVETDGDRRLIMACLRYTDPVRAARLSGVLTGAATVEGLHPDDAGDPHVHHDFLAPVQEVTSAFVWIPVFEAYQLIRPANCGPPLANRHRGTWVPGRPTVGTEDVDWACEVFGGFYAGKALASRIDAAPVLPGMSVNERSGSRKQIKVVPGCPPWVDVSWEDAVEICHRADPDCHLMKDDEYTALAVWATMHRLLEPAPGMSHRTHTAKQQGVIWATSGIGEWTASLVTDRHKLGGTPVNLDAEGNWPQAGVIASLSTDPALRRYGIPDATHNQQASFGSGRLDPPVPDEVAGVRGGSGIWGLSMVHPRKQGNPGIGFRPVLQYGLAPVAFTRPVTAPAPPSSNLNR